MLPTFLRKYLTTVFRSWPDLGSATAFAVRTWLTSMLAYWIACQFQLESPQWTMLTVWIVAQPRTGMLLSKSIYRVFGTLAGCFFGILLIAFFAQTPELFIAALALLMGLCTLCANLLTNFRAYAAVLAGYTAAIVSLDSFNLPETVFDVAMARGACILLAIACSVTVAALFAPHRSREEALLGLKNAIVEAARRAAFPWDGDHSQRLRLGGGLIEHLINLSTLIEFAAAESGTFRIHRAMATSLLVHLFGVISAKRSLDAHVLRCGMPTDAALVAARDECFAFLNSMAKKIDEESMPAIVRQIDQLRMQLAVLDPEGLSLPPEELVSHRVLIDRLDDILSEFAGAVEDWIDLHGRSRDCSRLPLNFHRDHRAALIHAARAVLTMGAVGAFWIASAWPSGPGALIIAAVICSLFSSLPHPDRVGWAFFQGSCVGIAAAFVCTFCMLNFVSNYEVVVVILGLFLVPCGILGFYPRTAGYAAAFAIVFINEVAPANPMIYNVENFLNNAIATLGGVVCGTLAYQLIFPPCPRSARKYVIYRIRLSLESIARSKSCPSTESWTTRMYDRVNRLHDHNNLSGSPTDEWLNTGLGSINLGCELFRARKLLTNRALPADLRTALEKVLAAFRQFLHHPDAAASSVQQALTDLSESRPGQLREDRLLWARAKGTVEEINACFEFPWSIINRPAPPILC